MAIRLQRRSGHWVRRLGECGRTLGQLSQGAAPREKREKAGPASHTSAGSHSSFPGWASNPFPGSRPCITSPAAREPPVAASPQKEPIFLPYCPSFKRSEGPSTSSPQNLGISCYLESLECFLPYPLGCPFLITLLTLQVSFWVSGRAVCPQRSHSFASPPNSH